MAPGLELLPDCHRDGQELPCFSRWPGQYRPLLVAKIHRNPRPCYLIIIPGGQEHPAYPQKTLGIIRLNSAKREDGTHWKKAQIIQEFGFPILSKEIAERIRIIQNPTAGNAVLRHSFITGYKPNGEFDSFRKLPARWLKLFGGPENERYGTSYQKAPFLVSDECCYYLKEKPCDDWAKEHDNVPYLGLMASEGGRRQKSYMRNGCNYYGVSTIRSGPFAIFTRQDILQLAIEVEQWCKHQGLLEQWGLETIVPEVYGTIERKADGTLYTTRAQRIGCSMCGFGIHMEKRPHRFDRLYEDSPKEWEFWMIGVGWCKALDYIGVEWRQDEHRMMYVTAAPAK